MFFLIFFLSISDNQLDPDGVETDATLGLARGMLVMVALVFAVLPTISLSIALGRTTTAFLRSRRPG